MWAFLVKSKLFILYSAACRLLVTRSDFTDEDHEKRRILPKFSQSETILVKMGELLAHFDKKNHILRKFGKKSVFFS